MVFNLLANNIMYVTPAQLLQRWEAHLEVCFTN